MITIRIPTPLRPYTEGRKEVALAGKTVEGALVSLINAYPALKTHLFDDSGQLRSYVNVFVNDDDIRSLQGQDTTLNDDDRMMIVPSIAGGAVLGRTSGKQFFSTLHHSGAQIPGVSHPGNNHA